MYTLPNLVAVQRISNLPIIKSSLDTATSIYIKVKKSNRLIEWSLGTAEATVTIAIDLTKPGIVMLDGPIHLIDEILCKSLDMMEEAVPIIKSEPDKLYIATKEYVSSVMEPVLKRADSVKEIGIQKAVSYSSFAAESLDNALTVADGYVNKYLPELPDGSTNPSTPIPVSPEPQNPTERTIRHVNKFSKTLKRRLTQRTLYEARELKKQGVNVIHVLVQLVDLLAKDPRAFGQKMKDLWSHLSQDEPENQAPPQNLEQLIVMLTREGARRFVHVANFTATTTYNIPKHAKEYFTYSINLFSEYVQKLELTPSGIKRQAEVLRSAINDIFDKFLSLIKPSSPAIEPKPSITPLSNKASNKKKEKNAKNEEKKTTPNASTSNGDSNTKPQNGEIVAN
ncbi:lipid storage droplets surface-binding protein 1 isoform X2 [Planococcus citri]|uniref:lipid storage droplets surface-binding protein 1 isoform X2 n=1 Tax=Planococcus citri TaxID=170843 RepID=UPI0031F98860